MSAKMISMVRTADDIRKEVETYPGASAPDASAPAYPYGLCISFEDATLARLKLDGDPPERGEIIHFEAIARVTAVSDSERETVSGEKKQCVRVELQITDMGLIGGDRSEGRAKRFYGAEMGEPDGDED
jgi:hypothetical protein